MEDIVDEFAFLSYNNVTYKAVRPALNTAMEIAEKAGTPRGILITTTPNNLDTPSGAFCYNFIKKACKFNEEFYDLFVTHGIEYLKEYIETNSENGFIHIQFSYSELGRSEAWLKKQIRELDGDMLLVKRELLLEWTYASNVSPFDEELLDIISGLLKKEPLKNLTIPVYSKLKGIKNYKIDIVEDFDNLFYKSWILSIDVASGLDKDSSAFTLIDPLTYRPKMIFNSNNIGVIELANLIEKFVMTYVPNAVIIPERNNNGIVLIEHLRNSNVVSNLYFEEKMVEGEVKSDKKSFYKNKGVKTKKKTLVYGFNTTGTSRPKLIENLRIIVNDRPELINNELMFDEVRTLERKNGGKIEHQSGFHDDTLFSYLIGYTVLTDGTNINSFLKNIGSKEVATKQNHFMSNILELNNISNMNKITNTNDNSLSTKIIEEFQPKISLNDQLLNSMSFSQSNEKKIRNQKIKNIIQLNNNSFN